MSSPSNLIQIKRSQTVGTPTSLANGELAFSASSNTLFIGNFGTVTPIAGGRNPGVLTANQALVANSTYGLNFIKTANLQVQSITANGVSSPGAGYLIAVDAGGNTYWQNPTTFGVGSQYVTNTDSRVLSGNLTFSGALTQFTGANVNITTGVLSGNGMYLTGVNAQQLNGNTFSDVTIIVNAAYANAAAKAENAFSNAASRADSAYSNAVAKSISIAQGYADSAYSNAVTKAVGISEAYTQGYTVPLGTQTSGDYVADIYAGSGINVSTGTGAGSTPTISTVQDINPTSNVSFANVVAGILTSSGNTVLGTTSADKVTVNGSVASNLVPDGNNTRNLGSSGDQWASLHSVQVDVNGVAITASGSNINVQGSLSVNTSLSANALVVAHNLSVGGDLYVTGNVVSANIYAISVSDPLIHLGANNTTDSLDLGFYASYNTGTTTNYAGLVRDSSDKVFKLFTNLTTDPEGAGPISFDNSDEGTLKAFLISGALVSNSQTLTLTATSSTNVNIIANTLQLSTALNYQYGGTGFSSYGQGDLLVGNTTGGQGLSKLGLGTSGYVLMSDGTNLVYSTLDGGTF